MRGKSGIQGRVISCTCVVETGFGSAERGPHGNLNVGPCGRGLGGGICGPRLCGVGPCGERAGRSLLRQVVGEAWGAGGGAGGAGAGLCGAGRWAGPVEVRLSPSQLALLPQLRRELPAEQH